uniref:phytol kinase n=1 Tax=Tetradesmus obliquus TaxID=3088 RepID=A0A383VP93_TETOB|eukprot:jgi/Sobl393_1/8534/SZX66554.1
MLDGFVGTALLSDSDSELRETLEGLNPSTLQMLLTWSPLAEAAAADDVLMPSGRHTGRWAAGPLVLFRPGGVDPSSSSCSTAAWYSEEVVASLTPWLIVAARSMWLMGQLLCELLPASSSSAAVPRQQHSNATAAPLNHLNAVAEGYFIRLLERAYVCAEWLGSQLCHMQLPGDEVPTPQLGSSSSSSSRSPEEGAAHMPLLTQLLQQHAQQVGLYQAVQRCAAAGPPSAAQHDVRSTAASLLLQRVWGDALPGQLRAFGAAVAAALPVGWACNNAACTNLGKLSELQLVYGRAKLCSGCRQVRMCSAECQKQHWKAGHKLVCKKLAAAAAAEGRSTASRSGSAAAANSGGACSSSSSSAAGVAAAAGLELPGSAAAAAALPVRQLKALLVTLGVPGVAAAVEKSDLVALLVGHLGLS